MTLRAFALFAPMAGCSAAFHGSPGQLLICGGNAYPVLFVQWYENE